MAVGWLEVCETGCARCDSVEVVDDDLCVAQDVVAPRVALAQDLDHGLVG